MIEIDMFDETNTVKEEHQKLVHDVVAFASTFLELPTDRKSTRLNSSHL